MGHSLWIKFLMLGSIRNLWRSPRRTIISLLAIASAATALIVFQSFVEGVRSTFRENVITSRFGHYQLYHKDARSSKNPDPHKYLISDIPNLKQELQQNVGPVTFVSRQQQFFGLLSNGDSSTGGVGLGIDAKEEKDFLTLTQVHSGKHLSESGKESIFIGYEFAEKIGAKVGQYITVVVTTAEGSINALDLEVVGTFKSGVTEMDRSMYMIHYETAQDLIGTDGAQRILIGFDAEDETVYQKKFQAYMQAKHPKVEVVHWESLATYFENTMGWLDSIFFIFRIIIILIATLSIVNVFTITLLERTGEFGTLRAIGTKRSEIITMVLIEGFIQAVAGSILGVLGGIAVIKLALTAGISMPPPLLMSVPFHVQFAVPWAGVGLTAFLCTFIAGGSGIMPAIKMSRINIVQALGRNV